MEKERKEEKKKKEKRKLHRTKIFWRDLGHLDIPESTILVHYIDDSMLIWSGDHEVATTLDIQEINITKIQGSASPIDAV